MTEGSLIGVGVGPGDPELMTLKAVAVLTDAPVIAFIHAPGRESMAREIARDHLNPGALHLGLEIPMEESPEAAARAYDAQLERITRHLDAGDDVAFLCEGDPLFYGSFLSVMDRLFGRYDIEVVPGVTSIAAAAAAVPAGLARRQTVFSVVPATMDEDELALWLAGAHSAALIKAGPHLPKIRRVLGRLGLLSRALFCERIGHRGERILPLEQVTDETADYFSLVLIPERGATR